MTLREIFRQADKMPRRERIEFLKGWRDRHRKRSVPYAEIHAELVRQMMAELRRENRAA
jgi:hypothetical protein